MSHARLSPSSAHRWALCPGSVAMESARPDTSGDAAQLGTHAHAALEYCLTTWEAPIECVDAHFHDRDLKIETALAVQKAYDYVTDRSQTMGLEIYTETRVNPSSMGRDDVSGTADVILKGPDTLEVVDYKNGTGYVSEVDNLQLLIYLIGAMNTLGVTEWPKVLRATIIQPNSTGEPVRSKDYTSTEISQWITYLTKAANATDDPGAPRIPSSEACHWCKARGDCPERAGRALEQAREVFTPLAISSDPLEGCDSAKVSSLTPEQVRLILMSESFVLSVYKDVKAHAHGELSSGREVPGFKLIEGRKARSWNVETEELLRRFKNTNRTDKKKLTKEQYLSMKPLTPAAAEKEIKPLVSGVTWTNLSKLIDSVPGRPQIVPEGHSKPAVNTKPEEVFTDLTAVPDFLT